jgi:hypothetical protein
VLAARGEGADVNGEQHFNSWRMEDVWLDKQ